MRFIALASLLSLVLVGCGQNDDSKSSQNPAKLSDQEALQLTQKLSQVSQGTTSSAKDNRQKALVVRSFIPKVEPGLCLDSLAKLQEAYQQNSRKLIDISFGSAVENCAQK